MQIVTMNNQTFLTADSWKCLIDSNSESEVLAQNCSGLKLQREASLIDTDRSCDNNRAGKQINKVQ